jgi:hypothetical protein
MYYQSFVMKRELKQGWSTILLLISSHGTQHKDVGKSSFWLGIRANMWGGLIG